MRIRDIAWAKLNLTLEVLGRREDGFHELRSLVAFVGAGDTLEFASGHYGAPRLVSDETGSQDQSEIFTLDVEGPYADALEGANLILEAAQAARARFPVLSPGRFRLVKTLPVAAGLGGGSADAAAALRLLMQTSDGVVGADDIASLAPELGSDVAVCLRSTPAFMTGRGEIVEPVTGFPQCGVLLVNPGVELATGAVYGALGAAPLKAPPQEAHAPDFGGDFEALIAYAAARGNDLEPAALKLAPEIGGVLSKLQELKGVRLVRLSGSGATCFAVFASPREALWAAILLAEHEPEWWITAGVLGDPKARLSQ
ncbi:4-(cytidine 5'-diphospho)-2-C-methyl-D-erythritol kinase [Methyloceanibacter caenitepidi]|uniref:4-diphosphocytidyl-2-C-methyl-D-erythritol kinase n=1 Tax=Methyloceanibacter caenitepidi TaxID=1384459 RepID=A0A0A8K0J3_9HYPH|nr:4-(cytidine 5'-diphospho)-2-C-methyl-D-erythritol kinase [Methyloceanibacter caenitepidi]BAQ16493.1 4-diphosphocytidyl-2-C-methyl-D-erythritol kinase [Methyloceanibacter caenitepidi]